MAQWYYMKDGQKHGPVDTAGLKQLASAGRLQPTDMIWADGLPNWVPASRGGGLEFGQIGNEDKSGLVASPPGTTEVSSPARTQLQAAEQTGPEDAGADTETNPSRQRKFVWALVGMAGLVVIGLVLWAVLHGPTPAPNGALPKDAPKELTLELGNKVTMKLVLIPAGKFMMGSPETEKDRNKDEAQHEVTISKAFYMGATHVTVDQFAAFATAGS